MLLGHSMGARIAVHAADDPSVVGVVGLAPWWSAEDMGGLGHYMLTGSQRWHDVALASVLEVLGSEVARDRRGQA